MTSEYTSCKHTGAGQKEQNRRHYQMHFFGWNFLILNTISLNFREHNLHDFIISATAAYQSRSSWNNWSKSMLREKSINLAIFILCFSSHWKMSCIISCSILICSSSGQGHELWNPENQEGQGHDLCKPENQEGQLVNPLHDDSCLFHVSGHLCGDSDNWETLECLVDFVM